LLIKNKTVTPLYIAPKELAFLFLTLPQFDFAVPNYLLGFTTPSAPNNSSLTPNTASLGSSTQTTQNLLSTLQSSTDPRQAFKKAIFRENANQVQTGRTHDHGYSAIDLAPNHALINKLGQVPIYNPGGNAIIESINANEGGYGHSVVLKYPDGSKLRVAHLEKDTVTGSGQNGQVKLPNGQILKVGEAVAPGAQIGGYGMNSTGRTTGPHCHAEVIKPDGTRLSFDSKDAINQLIGTLPKNGSLAVA
jgi:murein DD-endopeptidase MepM/ murein hydrolase activator NlpD